MSLSALWSTLMMIWAGLSATELAGAVLGLVYVVLVIVEHRACWVAALLSTTLYLYVFYQAGLFLQAALQGYYIGVALYGWSAWRKDVRGVVLPVTRVAWPVQVGALFGIVLVSLMTASWLARETGSTQPLMDSLTTWASVFATWLVARKKLENWLWWFVIDALIMVLCYRARLYPSMVLYACYLALVLVGWRAWRKEGSVDTTAPAALT